jgi:hypothetical protein
MQVAVDARAQLDIAYAAATGMHPRYIPVVSAWNGACIEAAYKNIHYAEALIAHLYNEEDVWRASHISDSGPNKVPFEMEEHRCGRSAGNSLRSSSPKRFVL